MVKGLTKDIEWSRGVGWLQLASRPLETCGAVVVIAAIRPLAIYVFAHPRLPANNAAVAGEAKQSVLDETVNSFEHLTSYSYLLVSSWLSAKHCEADPRNITELPQI